MCRSASPSWPRQRSALALLAILTAAVVALVVFETWHLGEEHVRIRHAHD